MTELKLVWLVNMTGHHSKIILSTDIAQKLDTVHANYLGLKADQIDSLDGLLLHSHFLCLSVNQTGSASCFFPRIIILDQGSH